MIGVDHLNASFVDGHTIPEMSFILTLYCPKFFFSSYFGTTLDRMEWQSFRRVKEQNMDTLTDMI